MHGLVSFTLYGDNPLYLQGAVRNAYLWVHETPLDVRCRFYVGESVPDYYIRILDSLGAEIVPFWDYPEDYTATFWRFDALRDHETYDYVLFRDCDSRPSPREIWCIQDWLESKRKVHIIRDHPCHGVPVLAGLWGAVANVCGVLKNEIPAVPPEDFYKTVEKALRIKLGSNNCYQIDQWWLNFYLHRRHKPWVLAHDEFFHFDRKQQRREILLDRPGDFAFIGEGFDEWDRPRHPEHRDILKTYLSDPRAYRARRRNRINGDNSE